MRIESRGVALLCTVLFGSTVGCAGRQARTEPAASLGPDRLFSVAIEQAGRKVSISDHRATLMRQPFDLVLEIAEGKGVALNAAFKPRLYEAARNNEPLARHFMPAKTAAEENGNPRKTLLVYINSDGNHFLVRDKGVNRCNSVQPIRGGYRCRRSVSNITIHDDRSMVARAIRELEVKALYLVFFVGLRKGDLEVVEQQRDFLELKLVGGSEYARAHQTSGPAAWVDYWAFTAPQLESPVTLRLPGGQAATAPVLNRR